MVVDMQVPTSGANSIQERAVRISVRPPLRHDFRNVRLSPMAKEIRALCACSRPEFQRNSGWPSFCLYWRMSIPGGRAAGMLEGAVQA